MYALLQAARPAALMSTPFPQLHPAADGAALLLTIAISAALAGLVFSVLAVVLYVRLANARRTARFELERTAGQIMRGIEMRQSEHLEASAVIVRQGFCPDCGLPHPIPGAPSSYSDGPRE